MTRLTWTLLAVAALGGTAVADTAGQPASAGDEDVIVVDGGSRRGVAEDYLVLPAGGELTGQIKLVTADSLLGGPALKLTDVGLFGVSGRWALVKHLELSASADFLPKQPSFTDEEAWQSGAIGLRTALGHHAALAIDGAGGHLFDSTGFWNRESATVEWKKTIDPEWLAFDLRGGASTTGLGSGARSGRLTEVALATSALFREPSGHWGAWLGVGYAVPVEHRGVDPTTDMHLDPQPRLDLHLGTVLSIVRDWDLFVDFAVIDRGDAMNRATELPILDGGFDQKQLVLGVTWHDWSGVPRDEQ